MPASGLRDLLALFGDDADGPRFTPVDGSAVPQPYRRLLVHDDHMTVSLETYHGGPVSLAVHDALQRDDDYARKLTLHAGPTGPPVLLGIMRFDLRCCNEAIRAAVTAGRMPLGRILIEHDVLRRLRPGPYYRVAAAGPTLLGVPVVLPAQCHARLACIECNGGVAVRVLEVITAI